MTATKETSSTNEDESQQPGSQDEQEEANQTVGEGDAIPSRSAEERDWTFVGAILRPNHVGAEGSLFFHPRPLWPNNFESEESSFRPPRRNRDAERTQRRSRRRRRNPRLSLIDDSDEYGYDADEGENPSHERPRHEPSRPSAERVEGIDNQHEDEEPNILPNNNREDDNIHTEVINQTEGANTNNQSLIAAIASPLGELENRNDDAISRWNEPLCSTLTFCTYGRVLLCTICGIISMLIFLASFITAFATRINNSNADPDVIVSGSPTFNPTLSPTISSSVQIDEIKGGESSPNSTTWKQMGSALYGDRYKMFFGYPIVFLDNGDRFWTGGVGVLREYEWEGSWSSKSDLLQFYGIPVTSISITPSERHMVVGSSFFGDVGIVIIYNKVNETNWVLQNQVVGNSENQNFGFCVDITDDGNLVAAGSNSAGYLKIIGIEGTEYKVINKFKGEGIDFGYALVLSSDGKRLITNAPLVDRSSGKLRDSVRIINPHDGSLIQEIICDFKTYYSVFGCALAMSTDESYLVVGACKGSYAKVYKINSQENQFVQYGDVLESVQDSLFGYSVSLSADGSRVAVGAPKYTPSGMTFVYSKNAAGWTVIGELIGEIEGDWSGSYVTLSEDGNKVAIGAFYNDGGGSLDGGQLRVYEYVSC